ncbi:hypothetical protein [Allobranchiibius sp. GilTou38]|uniref:hypothetical protein n=1 Tax=Allobranchiibius sp. GilTou38 TaxID=2815210 RepID=UPI001AA0F94A|nr:hypothetical protein [Allobranchiibius sp. GilTou38]MBO1766871.1 hypothetical protein [Allobranchiibius sp. GilTou38]
MGFLSRRGRDLTPPPPAYGPTVPRPFSELLGNAPSSALETLARHARVPDAARERILRLDTQTLQAQQYLAARGITGRDAFEVVQIRDDFGPSAVHAYLGLPPTTADTAVLQDGRTGADLLIEELDLLLEAVRGLLDRAGEVGQTQLRANHRFLEEKYGERDPGLEL